VTVYDPAGVDAEVAKVRVDVQAGLHEALDNVTVVPAGAPEAESDTACVVPETRPMLTGNDTDCPAVTLPVLASESEKSKAAVTVNVREALCCSDPDIPVTVIT